MSIPRILVVEDEVIVAKTITRQLQQLGYVVTGTASSGTTAIDKVASTSPDLILMDIVLKGELDGITTAAQIRQQQNIPIIYLTAYADDNTLQRAKVTEPYGYIVKPFTANDLRVAIEIGLFKHQVSQELQENRDQLATLLQSMGDGVISCDTQGCVTYMNPVAEILTGWQQSEAIGKAVTEVFQLIDEVTQLPADDPVTRVLQQEETVCLHEFTALVNRIGTQIPIGDSASPLRRSTGEISGVVLVFRDMTDRRQAEFLAQALKKEQALNQLKSQFVSTVSHEFRNPLAAILFSVELLEKAPDLPTNRKNLYFQRIRAAVRSMNELMEDVLVIGQAEADRLAYHPTEFNLELFCRNLVDDFLLVKEGEHPIELKSQGGDIQVWMDEKLLRYILTNLLSNAIKYSAPESRINFLLTVDQTTRTATFQIQDQGIGIPEADQPQLFESFFRASNARTIQGTGLGLAIVKRCVEAHQGTILLASQIGIGTTVNVVLPIGSAP